MCIHHIHPLRCPLGGNEHSHTQSYSNLGLSILPKDTSTCGLDDPGIKLPVFDLMRHSRQRFDQYVQKKWLSYTPLGQKGVAFIWSPVSIHLTNLSPIITLCSGVHQLDDRQSAVGCWSDSVSDSVWWDYYNGFCYIAVANCERSETEPKQNSCRS